MMALGGGAPSRADERPAAEAGDSLDNDDATSAGTFPDPLEKLNRLTFGMNRTLDRWVFDPIARAYAFVVPLPARKAVRRALTNLDSPAIFVNDLLQLEPRDAGVTAARFAINTTAGIAGLFDAAGALGLERHVTDFGVTLALMGVPSGPYLMLPILGPSTARDSTGFLVDFFFRPTTYILTPGALIVVTSVWEGSAGIASREEHAEQLRILETSAVDYYAALRNAFYQNRMAQIHARRAYRLDLHLSFAAAGGEIGDLVADRVDEDGETGSFDH
jgi:phospholipid-binding lipoprotein MlaA